MPRLLQLCYSFAALLGYIINIHQLDMNNNSSLGGMGVTPAFYVYLSLLCLRYGVRTAACADKLSAVLGWKQTLAALLLQCWCVWGYGDAWGVQ